MNTDAHPVRAREALHGRDLHHRDRTEGGSLGSDRLVIAVISFNHYCKLLLYYISIP